MKTKIKKRTVDTQQKCESDLFPSMMRPLREILEERHEPGRRDAAFHRVRRKTLSANEGQEKTMTKMNGDRFSLRVLLCDEEAYALMSKMALTQEKKVRQALLFLREYSLLIKRGSFEMRVPVDTSPIIVFALKHVSSYDIKEAISSGDYRPLIKGLLLRVEREIELVKSLLRDFIESHFFKTNFHKEKAHLSSFPEKRIPLCEEAEIQRNTESCELIRFSMHVEKEEVKLHRTKLNRTKQDRAKKPEGKIDALSESKSKAKRAKTVLKVAGLIVPALKIVGFLIPCLALAAIPGVGFLLSLACLVLLSAAAFTYYMVPSYKKEKKEENVLKEEKWEEAEAFSPSAESQEGKRERRKIVTPKTEKMMTESAFMHETPPSPKDLKTSLGGGQWLKEDRKRREQRAANDKVSPPYKDKNPHPSFPNRHYGRGKPM